MIPSIDAVRLSRIIHVVRYVLTIVLPLLALDLFAYWLNSGSPP